MRTIKKTLKKCVNCNKMFFATYRNQKVCSKKCAWERIKEYQKEYRRLYANNKGQKI